MVVQRRRYPEVHGRRCLRHTSGSGILEEQASLQPQSWLFDHEQVVAQLEPGVWILAEETVQTCPGQRLHLSGSRCFTARHPCWLLCSYIDLRAQTDPTSRCDMF